MQHDHHTDCRVHQDHRDLSNALLNWNLSLKSLKNLMALSNLSLAFPDRMMERIQMVQQDWLQGIESVRRGNVNQPLFQHL